ncbi:hypothetical protein A8924_0460 [Saccharopolyspora erythraea NRRL 2338]|uniref:Uncharacterized protein n=2 Tax=Saccharopolyspora erythraea TaxID=1836 RepID=A4F5V4_SACEN|nr:hypothetical protein [Saccharopolyspora erythraea]PFG93227.1 hypothetical protein A8924_0460 [Saccharopolyspora erythraea NRRL 2338]QRK90082.1 hypothetical protein JQX30_00370 [Saccharopolyspora erythraea]CAL99428.1 hypothetical protein SACE_0075 [Saccharopolyspora erythraea NRRL 2338]
MTIQLTPAKGALRVLRGAGLAITSASLSVAAHMTSGGSLPDPGTTALITALLSGAGVALAGRRRGLPSIVGALAVAQLALHVFLQLAGSHQGTPGHLVAPFDPVGMSAGHALAALLTAVLLARAERALFVIARLLGLFLPPSQPRLLTVTKPGVIRAPARPVRIPSHQAHLRRHPLRGPPAHSW